MAHRKVCRLDSDRFDNPINFFSIVIANNGLKQVVGLILGAKTISLIGYSFMALPAVASDNDWLLCVDSVMFWSSYPRFCCPK